MSCLSFIKSDYTWHKQRLIPKKTSSKLIKFVETLCGGVFSWKFYSLIGSSLMKKRFATVFFLNFSWCPLEYAFIIRCLNNCFLVSTFTRQNYHKVHQCLFYWLFLCILTVLLSWTHLDRKMKLRILLGDKCDRFISNHFLLFTSAA